MTAGSSVRRVAHATPGVGFELSFVEHKVSTRFGSHISKSTYVLVSLSLHSSWQKHHFLKHTEKIQAASPCNRNHITISTFFFSTYTGSLHWPRQRL